MKKAIFTLFILFPILIAATMYNSTIFSPKNQSLKKEEPKIIQVAKTIIENKKGDNFFVPVSHFSYLADNIARDELNKLFTEKQNDIQKYYILEEDKNELNKYFQNKLNAQSVKDINELVFVIKVGDIALIPLDKLSPQLKVIFIDGQNILDKSILNNDLIYPKTKDTRDNRDTTKISQITMTGVTAISRTVQKYISFKNDPIYPARAVMEELKKSDLTHISSENSFFDTCPENPADSLTLCGKTASIESLIAVGADIVDLNGNHQTDFGSEKFLESINHLDENQLEYFGGGKNENDSAKILYKNIGDTKIAFLGYAYFDSLNGKAYRNIANGDRPGVNFYDQEKVKKDIALAKQNAEFVIVDYQFTETYSYLPLPEQKTVFRQTIDFGADLVVGVQAHQPQKIEFYKNKPIFYGLGNFFFDQMWSYPTRQGLIPRLTFYDGKLTSIEILTTLLYDYSQPRFTIGTEREDLLKEVLP